jgi:hypothetical protein
MSKEELERQCRNKGLLTNGTIATLRKRLRYPSANDYKLQYLKDKCKENNVSDKGTKQQLYDRWKAPKHVPEDDVPIHKRVIQEKEYKKIVNGKDLVIPDHIRVLHFDGPVKGTFKVPNFVTDVILEDTSSSSIKTNDTQRRHIFMTEREFYIKLDDDEREVDRAAKDKRNRFYVINAPTNMNAFKQNVKFYALNDGKTSHVVVPVISPDRIFKFKDGVPLKIKGSPVPKKVVVISDHVAKQKSSSKASKPAFNKREFFRIDERVIQKDQYKDITYGNDHVPDHIRVLHFYDPAQDTFVVPDFVTDVILSGTPSDSIITNDNQRRHIFMARRDFYVKYGYKERAVDRAAQDERNRFYVTNCYNDIDTFRTDVALNYKTSHGHLPRVVVPDVPPDRIFEFKGYNVPIKIQ